ncbi:hypothetical protein NQ314_020872 [Rhamnusium bicolor]|uniref:PiggyBac transposable element-derived protein domain-containing protein n=1 Tax=Rhamnusium bicolor TaxID=1586634 RepID=A0AAV8WIZ3_9CUCU|nr:hypothetical protein NQ314_020872 [Rhamnusium bicolor]
MDEDFHAIPAINFYGWKTFHTLQEAEEAIRKLWRRCGCITIPSNLFTESQCASNSRTRYCAVLPDIATPLTPTVAKTMKKDKSFGLSANVVISLLEHLENPGDHMVYFDNFFSTLGLMNRLKTKGIRTIGTLCENQQKNCTLQSSKMMDKKERGTCDYRFDSNNQLLIVKWNNNSVYSMVTNHDFIKLLSYVKRWFQSEKEIVAVKQPLVFQNYTAGMRGALI